MIVASLPAAHASAGSAQLVTTNGTLVIGSIVRRIPSGSPAHVDPRSPDGARANPALGELGRALPSVVGNAHECEKDRAARRCDTDHRCRCARDRLARAARSDR
jgi:hypothetical protein